MRLPFLALLVCSLPALAAGEGRDYDTANRDWRGLSDLASIAAARGLTFEERSQVSWSELGPSDVLFIIYPTTPIEPAQLKAFLRGGGRVLIADDFGSADKALAAVGVLRRPAPREARALDGNPNLPFARPSDDGHALTRGVREPLVTNHPSTFRVSGKPDVVYTVDGQPVVVAGTYDESGVFVAISDPSILINGMLAFDSNLAFAVNLLDFLAKTRPGRIVLITHDASLTGEPAVPPEPKGEALGANDLLKELSPFLEELNEYIAPEWVLRIVGVVLGGLALVVGLIVVPLRRGREPDDGFARLPGEPSGNQRLLSALDDDRHEASYAYPATILRENVEAELEARRGSGRREVDYALALLQKLPAPGGVRSPEAFVSRRDFIEAHAAVAAARRVR